MLLSLQFSHSPRSNNPLFPTPHVPHQSPQLKPHVLPPTHLPKPLLCATAHHVILADNAGPSVSGSTVEEELLPAGLRRESMPKHVAVIMDGNRRWARLRGLPVGSGYEAGVRSLRVIVELCCKWGIRVLTVFAFSSENWFRPQVEVEFLMSSFERGLREQMESFVRENIQISIIGDSSKLPKSLQELITNVEETTKNNTRLQLIIAVSYSGQYDIVQACQRIALKVKDGIIEANDINESLIKQELETKCTEFPYPDLLIRTGGELRVGATSVTVLRSVWQAYWLHENLDSLDNVLDQLAQSLLQMEVRFEDFIQQLNGAGWDTHQINLKVPREISIEESCPV